MKHFLIHRLKKKAGCAGAWLPSQHSGPEAGEYRIECKHMSEPMRQNYSFSTSLEVLTEIYSKILALEKKLLQTNEL